MNNIHLAMHVRTYWNSVHIPIGIICASQSIHCRLLRNQVDNKIKYGELKL